MANLQAFCHRELPQQSIIEIVDINQSPEVAEAEKILITPTLIKEFPLPQERIIGDISNIEVLAFALNLSPKTDPASSFKLTEDESRS